MTAQMERNTRYIIEILLSIWWLFTVFYLILVSLPNTVWFEYQKIDSEKPQYNIGQDIFFHTHSIVHRKVDLYYTDVLMCDIYDNAWYRYYSVYYSSELGWQPRDFSKWSPAWKYNGNIPKVPAKCYLDTTVVADIGYGIKKRQQIVGEDFIIK